jgi:hypothetical protein
MEARGSPSIDCCLVRPQFDVPCPTCAGIFQPCWQTQNLLTVKSTPQFGGVAQGELIDRFAPGRRAS